MRPPRRTPTARAEASPPPPPRGRRAHAGPPADEGPDPLGEPSPQQAPQRAGRGITAPRTVRAKIVCLLMVPVVSLLALWGHATVTTAQDVARLRQIQRVDATVRAPVAAAVAALQAERSAAVRRVTDASSVSADDLAERARATDRAVAKLRLGEDGTVAYGEELPRAVADRLEAFVTATERLRPLRTDVREGDAGWRATYDRYTDTIAAAFGAVSALTGLQDADLGSDARVLLEFSRAGEALAQEDALLAGARLDGGLAGERLRLFTGAVALRRGLTDSAVTDLRGPERTAWTTLAGSDSYAALAATEDKVLTGAPGSRALEAAPAATWDTAHARVRDGMRTIEADAARRVAHRADPLTRGLLTPAGAAVFFGLAAVAASLVISVRIGRGLVIELVRLRNDALEIARRKLPEAMRKLRAGEDIDIRAEAPAGPPAQDETGQVAEALGTVHRAALRAAVERAELAGGISGVFVNLARRSQVLVHRQLSLLDSMERRSDDPGELSDLFRLDHLTTRMRRHAESLIILSGAAPGRAWRMPVSLTNVVRAAVSEVEDYARVEVRQLPETSVVGAAVADLTHLLAEIIENAAQFSPPHTRVRVTGEPVGNGYAVEVEDRGLGMGKETLAEANRRIAQSEALDLFDSDRLGLFVVSRLAARHDIKVHLKTSPYGGTTAVVLLPTSLLDDSAAAASPGGTRPARPVEERTFARVPGEEERTFTRVPGEEDARARVPGDLPQQRTVPAPDDRPALVAPVASAAPPTDGADTAAPNRPPGVATLRLHRPQEEPAGSDDLPRRVRQASLAPQLRESRTDTPAPARRDQDDRTPELVRDRMTAYRAGWTRGGGRQPGRGAAPGTDRQHDGSEGDPA
ncbi:nitrate- and nitrite sensing domain-containing protein [Streptomyces sp. 15-116A]|uniref:sensor histidine kinase n=1 Tax=Streptomyces sp. 15-116A TaxID=2259035 RepID=UPI0021B40B4C|nr:nitrate- and nitrite sensing domain-containing protein [Streptomyces sp. 15-116A]MCT7353020.1 nitrate- and nitrite sensing domain-containing protein [Streptomyces sp. 15-116A]